VLIAILGVPFKCPPAPYEGALLLRDYLVEHDVRDATRIDVISPMDSPVPVSRETSSGGRAGKGRPGRSSGLSAGTSCVDQ
jgi:sulfide:quinone oxidoreductase